MKPLKPINVFLRILFAWLVASFIGLYFGRQIMVGMEPLFTSIVLLAQSDFSSTLDLVNHDGTSAMQLVPLTIRSVQLTPDMHLREGFLLDAVFTSVDHAVLPLVLFLMVMIAAPIRSGLREAGLRMIFGLPGAIIVMAVTTPLFLAARVQMNTMQFALQMGGKPAKPFLIDWMIFTESGGRWLIPIVVGIVCISLCSSILKLKNTSLNLPDVE